MSSVDFSTTSRAGYSYSKTGLYGPGYYKYNTSTSTSTSTSTIDLPPEIIFVIVVFIIIFGIGIYVVRDPNSCQTTWNQPPGIFWCTPKKILAGLLTTPVIGITLLLISKYVDEEKEKTKKKVLEVVGWIFMAPSIIAAILIAGRTVVR
jgi:hypothetical protein